MNISSFLNELLAKGIILWAEGDKLLYRGPSQVLTPELLGRIKARKEEILESLHLEGNTAGGYPLSHGQRGLWFIDQLKPGTTAYNVPACVRMAGPLNASVLEQSLNEIIRRHDTLRTTFAAEGGEPVQVIAPSFKLNLPVIDLQKLPETEKEKEVDRLFAEEGLNPFDLGKGPLIRAALLCIREEEHILLVTMHHIISDGWSVGVFNRELAALYGALSREEPSPLPELPMQYKDFAQWRRQLLQGNMLESRLSYWKQKLEGSPPILELPIDHPRPAIQTFQGTRQSLLIPKGLTDALKELSRREGATLFMTLLAAFKVLLYRYTQQDDILVGTPNAGRQWPEVEQLIGFFVNNLVLRTDVSGQPSFRELLSRVREVTLGAYAHQDLPFELLVEELQHKRDLSYNPLFQVSFNLLNFPESLLRLPDLTMSPVPLLSVEAQFDLAFNIVDGSDGLEVSLTYNTDLFKDDTISRMSGHFRVLLEAIVADQDQLISALPLLTEEEKWQFDAWNDTGLDYPKDVCLHQLFEAQVERTPNAVALIFEEESLTYRELNNQANRLAHYLRKLGVGPDVLVGICADRSMEMVIGLYAILKAGGAYVPLDPNYPKDRLECMLEDSRVPVILVQKRLVDILPRDNVQVLFLDELLSNSGSLLQPGDDTNNIDNNPECITQAGNMAYVIFTSGSTGRPKGVMNSHRAICNRLLWMQDEYNLTSADVVLQKTPFSFDVSVWEFFWPLLTGARLVVARPEGHRDSAYLVEVIREHGVTTLHFVPSMLHFFVEDPGAGTCSSLKRVICSGEALPYELQERFFSKINVELHNLYGPTEAAVDVTYWACQHGSDLNIVPIGSPVANTQMYILDQYMHPVPIGISGELHIGGVQVALGYINRPELTEEKFIPDPFSNDHDARLYKTGDLCRYLPDGNIEYLGRNDFQVKIRGLRIELGEIESLLAADPSVKQCVVVAREDVSGDKRLVAYLVPHKEAPSIDGLRKLLKKKLADYMIPSAFVILDQLPLSPNGKIDRKALPEPDAKRPELEGGYVAPRTPVEEKLAEIWAEVLKVEKVGVYDNFFDLGGHSLMATRILSQIPDAFQVELPLSSLFETPTIAAIALTVTQRLNERNNTKPDRLEKIEALEQDVKVDELSDEDVDLALKALLSENREAGGDNE